MRMWGQPYIEPARSRAAVYGKDGMLPALLFQVEMMNGGVEPDMKLLERRRFSTMPTVGDFDT